MMPNSDLASSLNGGDIGQRILLLAPRPDDGREDHVVGQLVSVHHLPEVAIGMGPVRVEIETLGGTATLDIPRGTRLIRNPGV